MWTAPFPAMSSTWRSASCVGKKQLGKIIDKCIRKHGFTIATEMLDRIKALGYKYSTKGAIYRVHCGHGRARHEVRSLIEAGRGQGRGDRTLQYRQGFITNDERYRLVVQQWEKTTADVTNALQGNLDRVQPHLHDG